MKNLLSTIILVACAASVFTACQKDNSKGKLDPSAKVYISPAPGVKAAAANPEHLSAREIVLQAQRLVMDSIANRGIDDWSRDTVNNRLLMLSTDVIEVNGDLATGFIEARDIIFVTVDAQSSSNRAKDTIAYISNQTMDVAEKAIREAFGREDYTSCYKLFETAFTFVPITGKEWLNLKAQGKQ